MLGFLFSKISARRDSNSRPSPWQGDALPLSHSRKYNTCKQYFIVSGRLCQALPLWLNRTHPFFLAGVRQSMFFLPPVAFYDIPLDASSPVLSCPVLITQKKNDKLLLACHSKRETRFELATLALARRCSTPEPLPHV